MSGLNTDVNLRVSNLVGEVQLVGVVDQSAPEVEGQPTFQEPDGAVNEGGRNGNEEPLEELQHEGPRVLLDYRLHYQT